MNINTKIRPIKLDCILDYMLLADLFSEAMLKYL